MLLAGDELAQTQHGNNNPYCQDNVLTWIAWEALSAENFRQYDFVRKLIKLRKKCPAFRRRHFFTGKVVKDNIKDITWYNEYGAEFSTEDWHDGNRRCLSYCVYANDTFYVCIFNANHTEKTWKLPPLGGRKTWNLQIDSSGRFIASTRVSGGGTITLPAWSVLLFEIKN